MYLSYEEYCSFGGKLGPGDYKQYGWQAQDELDAYTMGRLKKAAPIPCKVKRVLKRMTDILYKKDNEPQVTSQKNDTLQVSFAESKSYDEQLFDIMDTLSDVVVNNVPLLYRGIC